MVKICVDSKYYLEIPGNKYEEIVCGVCDVTTLAPGTFYLEQNGKRLQASVALDTAPVHLRLRVLGGKGGFGSMLRAIGAQIEKTTNREACRDLSGRRLRDINEEKRLKAWLEKQGEREREAEERKKRKIQKLLAVPKHEFKDEDYEEARSKLTEKVCDAVEEGLKKSAEQDNNNKRKAEPSSSQTTVKPKKKKALWIDDDLSDGSDSSGSDDSDDSEDNQNSAKSSTALSKTIATSSATKSKEVNGDKANIASIA